MLEPAHGASTRTWRIIVVYYDSECRDVGQLAIAQIIHFGGYTAAHVKLYAFMDILSDQFLFDNRTDCIHAGLEHH